MVRPQDAHPGVEHGVVVEPLFSIALSLKKLSSNRWTP